MQRASAAEDANVLTSLENGPLRNTAPSVGTLPTRPRDRQAANREISRSDDRSNRSCGCSRDLGGITNQAEARRRKPMSTKNTQDSKQPAIPPLSSSALLAAVKAWRTAEVHHAALTLELRDGDEVMAKSRLDDCTRELRIAADNYIKAANGEVSEPGDRHAGNATGAQSPGSLH